MQMMHAVVVDHPGAPDVLSYREVPRPALKPGWSLVRVHGFGINHSEVFTRQGLSPSVEFPRILGIEVVGEVAATTAPDQFTTGQTVISIMGEMGRAFDGSYAEYVLLPNEQLYPITTDLSWAELAALPETGYTAYGALRGLRLQPQDRVLIRGGSSGVGMMAAKLAHALQPGIRVTSTTRHADKAATLQEQGADQVLTGELTHLPAAATFDKILDLIGPKTAKDSLQHLTPGGIVSSTGELGGQWAFDAFEPIGDIPNNRYLTSFSSGEVEPQLLQELVDLVTEKHVDIHPTKVFTLREVAQAHAEIESRQGWGKYVVVIEA